MNNLLSWHRSGFSACATQTVAADHRTALQRLVRYVVRVPFATSAVRQQEADIVVSTPPDPRTGKTEIVLDPLDWIHAVTAQIPDRGQHPTRAYGHHQRALSAPRGPA